MFGEYFCQEEDAPRPGSEVVLAAAPLAQMDDNARKEYWACLALRHCPGLGIRGIYKLLCRYGSAYAAFSNSRDWIKLGFSPQLHSALAADKWRNGAKEEWSRAAKLDAAILLWPCSQYPQRLREIAGAPSLLYCKGDVQLLNGPCVAVVGSRKASRHNLDLAANFGRGLSACGITVVSGMALGIDRQAHVSALRDVGKSIGVLGTGIDMAYPLANRDLYDNMAGKGLLISEFAPQTPPGIYNFPVRNRIISGISLAVLVIEAAQRSGSLITARLALEQNREVFAVPGEAMSARSMGCQNLIRQGAHPAFCVADILELLDLELRSYGMPEQARRPREQLPPRRPDLDAPAAKPAADIGGLPKDAADILRALNETDSMNIDDLADKLGMPAKDVMSSLILLEIHGKVKKLPGANYAAAQ